MSLEKPGTGVRAGWLGKLLAAGFAAVALVSVSAASEPRIAIPAYNQFTPEDEAKIGAALARDFESNKEFASNPLLDRYLDDLMKRLGRASRRPELVYTCRLINSSEINAYSLPGGEVYVTTGLLGFVEDESELASVLAHEVGHIDGRHIMNRMSLEMRSQSLWNQAKSILPLLNDAQLQQAFLKIGIPITTLAAQQYDRANENEADLLAVYNLVRAGWNPLGEVRVLDRLQTPGGTQGLAAAMLAVHPDPTDRSHAVSAEIKTIALTGGLDENSLSFRAMKAGLGLLPKSGRSGH